MFRKEDFDSWNKLFPECKINENDLAHPTEGFLTRTLVHYLRAFGYKVEPPFPWHLDVTENTREKRLFLGKLTRNIDHIYKITDKTYSFTYYDLIKPTPKKTSHMLGILLNYLFYYNMYKTNVFGMATDRVKTRQELQKNITRTEQENDQLKAKAKKFKEEISKLAEELPIAKGELVNLKLEQRNKKEYVKQLLTEVDEIVTKNKFLHEQKSNFEQEIVPENELRKLENELGKLNLEIDDLKQQEVVLENSLKERKQHINSLQLLHSEVANAKDLVPLKLLEDFRDVIKQYENAKKQISATKQQEMNLLQNIEKLQKSLKNVEEKTKTSKLQFEKEHNKKVQALSKKEKECMLLNEQISQLKEEDHSLECALEEQKDIQMYLAENLIEIMSTYN